MENLGLRRKALLAILLHVWASIFLYRLPYQHIVPNRHHKRMFKYVLLKGFISKGSFLIKDHFPSKHQTPVYSKYPEEHMSVFCVQS